MTCIVGVVDKDKNRVVMGADSSASSDNFIMTRKDPKIFTKGEFLIGGTTSFRMLQLLRFSLVIPDRGNKELYEYMCTDFINAVRDCFQQGGFMQNTETNDELGGTFLVAFKHRLFEIQDDFQVAENLDGMSAVGCGGGYALGALYAMKDFNLEAEVLVRNALMVSENLALGVRSPFIILST